MSNTNDLFKHFSEHQDKLSFNIYFCLNSLLFLKDVSTTLLFSFIRVPVIKANVQVHIFKLSTARLYLCDLLSQPKLSTVSCSTCSKLNIHALKMAAFYLILCN